MSAQIIKDPQAPCSDKQADFLRKLLDEREVKGQSAARLQARLAAHDVSKSLAHDSIDWLLRRPVKAPSAPKPKVIDGPGIYVGSSGKVYTALQRKDFPSKMLWKYAYVSEGMKPKLLKVYSGQAIKDIETGGHKMTEIEADEFGKKWAWTQGGKTYSFCVCCGRLLTATESVNLGIGPICRGKTIWA